MELIKQHENHGDGVRNTAELKNYGFKVMYSNARDLNAHFLQIKDLINEKRPHILSLLETWLNDTIESKTLYIQGYQLIRNDGGLINIETGVDIKGGGVANYIHNYLSASVLEKSKVKIQGNQNL